MNSQAPITDLPSVCPLDCPDTCSLTARVQDGRLVGVRGSDANPYTAGVICNKVSRSYPDFVHGAGRLTQPLRRVGPRGQGRDAFEPISWDTALDLVHAGFRAAMDRHGPQSVLPFNYAGPHGELAGGSMDRRFFHHLGATLLDRGPLCGGVRGTAYASLYGNAPGMPPEQAAHADLIIVWGNNVTVSNLHLMRVLKRARAKGAKVVIIDPKRIKVAEQCDLHVPVHPGTDVVLALGLAAELERRNALDMEFVEKWTLGFDAFMAEARKYVVADVADICRIPADMVLALADLYQGADRVAASFGNGIERGKSGGAGLRAAMGLQALTGNHGRLGAGVVAKSGLAAPKTGDRLQRPDLIPAGTRTFNIVDVAEKLLDDTLDIPVGAVMIYNHNPVATHPDQQAMISALSRDDLFIAGSDVVMTDSMAFCDVILPAASVFEIDDIYGAYGQNYVQRAAPVIGCVGDALPNTEIFRRLAARFGFDGDLFTATDADLIDQAMDGADPRFGGTRPSQLPPGTSIAMHQPDGAPMILCDTVLPATPSGRIELYSDDLEKRFGHGVPRFSPAPAGNAGSLVLVTPSSARRTNATFGGCPESDGMEELEMNPADAAARGLTDGQTVTAANDQGAVTFRLKISDAVQPGVTYSPKGTWRASSQTGLTANALIPADIRTDIADGACYNETFIHITG